VPQVGGKACGVGRAEGYRVVRPEEVDHVQVEGVERFGPVEDHLLSLAQWLHQHLRGLQEAISINWKS